MEVRWIIVDKDVSKYLFLGITSRGVVLNEGKDLWKEILRYAQDDAPVILIMLIGEYQHTIDEKKRLAIPAKLRKELGKGAVLTRGLDNYLALYPLKEWEKLADKLNKLPTGQMEARGLARTIFSGAVEVEFDGLGRILVPDYLKQYAAIEKNVVIAGIFNHLEIWDQKQWDDYKQKTEKTVGDMAAKLSELGF